MSSYSDYFSSAASGYALYRPSYPQAMFDLVAAECSVRDRAWDCGTGSGQAALPLALRFNEVIASDPSVAQLAHAVQHPNISYVAMTAEDSALAHDSVSVVTVAQALHWFRLEEFYTEVRRVIRRGGVLAVWTYALFLVNDPPLDREITRFYREVVGPYWPPERALVEAGYRDIPFPFEEVATPKLSMSADWALSAFAGYLGTWSAVTRYRKATGIDPVQPFIEQLADSWGPPDQPRRFEWPLELRVGRI